MKKLIVIITLGLFTNFIAAQDQPKTPAKEEIPHATIYFVRTFNYFSSAYRNQITIPNQEPFSLGNSSLINYEVYSEGEIKILFEYSANSSQVILNVKRGENYYLYCTGFSLRQVEEKQVDRPLRKTENVIYLKEDLEYPINEESVADIPIGGGGQGTCFLISQDGFFVTNYHCIEKTKSVTISGVDGDFSTKYGVTVVASDPTNDLALLKIINNNVKFDAPPFDIRASGVEQAEKIYALGFPNADAMGADLKITEGIISSKSGVRGDISKYQISAAVNPGNSGGPLIDENGSLIGVIYAKSTVAESAGYAIKAGYLELFLKNVEGFTFPTYVNNLKGKSLPEKVAALKNIIFIVESK